MASIKVGPSPRAARAKASRVAEMTASVSLPSQRTKGTPYASPFSAKPALAVWRSVGTLMAQPLLRQKKMVGVLKTPAKFIPLWKSDELVAPSPKYVSATAGSRLILAAQAKPTAWVICVPIGELTE